MSEDCIVIPFHNDGKSVPVDIDLEFRIPERLSMKEAARRLRELHVDFVQMTGLQLKVGSISYYPSTGTICIDGQKGFKRKGFNFFLEILRSRGLCR